MLAVGTSTHHRPIQPSAMKLRQDLPAKPRHIADSSSMSPI